MHLVVHFAWKEKWPNRELYTDLWAVADGLFGQSENWKEGDWKIHDKEIWESGVCMDLPEWGCVCEDIYVLSECLPKNDLSRGGFSVKRIG